MKGLLAVFLFLALGNICLAQDCTLTTGNGEPGCRLPQEMNVFWQHNWDFTFYWRCAEYNRAVAVRCPPNCLFSFELQTCVDFAEWVRRPPCAPLTEPECDDTVPENDVIVPPTPAPPLPPPLVPEPPVAEPPLPQPPVPQPPIDDAVCIPTITDGQPGCYTDGELTQLWSNFWDYTRFWVCIELGRPAVSVNCPLGCLFDYVKQDCVFPETWNRPAPCEPPSTPECKQTCLNCEDHCIDPVPTPEPETPAPPPDTPEPPPDTPPTPDPETESPPEPETPPPPTEEAPGDCIAPVTDGRPCCSVTSDFLMYHSNFWRASFYWVCIEYRVARLLECPENCLFDEVLQQCVNQEEWVDRPRCERSCVPGDVCPDCGVVQECEDGTDTSGEPNCNDPADIGTPIRNNWDPTAYFYCSSLGATAQKNRCETEYLFLESAGECVIWYTWYWTCPRRETTALTTTQIIPTTYCPPARDGNGRPGCRTEIEASQYWRNNWDNTRYWVCDSVGATSRSVQCPSEYLFLTSAGACVPFATWVWECPSDPPTHHTDCPDGVCVTIVLPPATTPPGWTDA